MQKTIGGDRLGSGKKMQVDLHGFQRSTHDLGYVFRTTMSSGTLVPFMVELGLTGDTFDIQLNLDGKTHPTAGPLFGTYKAQCDTFVVPLRLYNSVTHNNALNIGRKMNTVKFPKLQLTALPLPTGTTNVDNAQINPSCVLNYLGIRGIGNPGVTSKTRKKLAVPFLGMYDIYKNFYANKQEEIGAVIHTPAVAIIDTVDKIEIVHLGTPTEIGTTPITAVLGDVIKITYTGTTPLPEQIIINTVEHGDKTAAELAAVTYNNTGTTLEAPFRQTFFGNTTMLSWRMTDDTDINTGKPAVATFNLNVIDDMREKILLTPPATELLIGTGDAAPYRWVLEQPNGIPNALSSQEGLLIKTYQSDIFNNWIQTEWIDGVDGITAVTSIDTTEGSFSLDQLLIAKKVYDMLNRIAISDGSFHAWNEVVYDHQSYRIAETPWYAGGLSKELAFQEVVSNSQSSEQPLGTLAGKGVMTGKHKGGNIYIKLDEPAFIMGFVSLTPRIDYSQGSRWFNDLDTWDDLHKPNLDEIGFEDSITEYRAWWDTKHNGTIWQQKSAGKIPAWMNYMTNYNRTYGNFAIEDNEMFMTLNRRFEWDADNETILDLTTYIDPSKFNFIFAETALDAQNFWIQMSVEITARRKMSAKIMPNL